MVKNDLFSVKSMQYGLLRHSIFFKFSIIFQIFMFLQENHRLNLHAYDLLLKSINPINLMIDEK
jgi:hypothetical protein